MIAPPVALRASANNLVVRMAANNLRSRSSAHSASVAASTDSAADFPALFTRPSTRPNRARTAAAKPSKASVFVTSTAWPMTSAVGARVLRCATARSTASGRRLQSATFAPSSTSNSASPRPRPSVPPVMTIVLPRSSKSMIRQQPFEARRP